MTYPTNVFVYEASMTVGDTEYTIDKATWADKSAWTGITWLYTDDDNSSITTEGVSKEFDVKWHESLCAIWPLPPGENLRTFSAFRVNGNIAGFYTNFYHRDITDNTVTGEPDPSRTAIIDSYRGAGHYKYMWALGTAILKNWNHNIDARQYHAATGLRKTLAQTTGATHKGTKVAHWDPTNTIFEQEWNVQGTEVGTAIENDSRFPAITVTNGTSPLTDSKWASPSIQEYLGTVSTPSPTENF